MLYCAFIYYLFSEVYEADIARQGLPADGLLTGCRVGEGDFINAWLW